MNGRQNERFMNFLSLKKSLSTSLFAWISLRLVLSRTWRYQQKVVRKWLKLISKTVHLSLIAPWPQSITFHASFSIFFQTLSQTKGSRLLSLFWWRKLDKFLHEKARKTHKFFNSNSFPPSRAITEISIFKLFFLSFFLLNCQGLRW